MTNTKFVFLATFSGSGSKLLQAQLSNLKNIFTIPAYPLLYFYPHFNEWKKIYKNKLNAKKVLHLILKKHKSIVDSRKIKGFNGLTNLGENKKQFLKISEIQFKKNFLKFLENKKINSANVIKAIHFAYKKTINDNKPFNLFHIHSIEYLNKYGAKDFPESKIIFTIRNPIYNFWRRIYSDVKIENIRFDYTDKEYLKNYLYLNRLRDIYITFKNINISLKKRAKFIKFEDIKLKNSKIIKKICKFLKIKYDQNNFTKLGFLGKKWWGDKIYKGYNEKQNFVKSNFNYDIELNSFAKYEILILKKILSPYLSKFRYLKKNSIIESFLTNILFLFILFFPTKYGFKLFLKRFNLFNFLRYVENLYNEVFKNNLNNYYFNAMYKYKWNYRIAYLTKYDFLRKHIFYNQQSVLVKIVYFIYKILLYFYYQLELFFLYFIRIYLIFSIFFIVRRKINNLNFS